jgi:hypothetical protein
MDADQQVHAVRFAAKLDELRRHAARISPNAVSRYASSSGDNVLGRYFVTKRRAV